MKVGGVHEGTLMMRLSLKSRPVDIVSGSTGGRFVFDTRCIALLWFLFGMRRV